MRLSGSRAFAAVYTAQTRVNSGPLLVYGKPNALRHVRMGLSVSRRVGTAVKRNRIKRLVREAFRLGWHDWPGGYDVVISVRAHDPLALSDYQEHLYKAIRRLHTQWSRRLDNPPTPAT